VCEVREVSAPGILGEVVAGIRRDVLRQLVRAINCMKMSSLEGLQERF
jgi:hypothetical protein